MVGADERKLAGRQGKLLIIPFKKALPDPSALCAKLPAINNHIQLLYCTIGTIPRSAVVEFCERIFIL